MKILITDGLSKEGLELFAKHKDLELDVRKKTDPQELKEIINNYQAVIIRSATKIDADVVSLLGEDFKLIGRAGIGVDNVDIKAASKKGIIVMNTPSANAITTAEHTIALLFSLARNTPQAFSSMKELKWERSKFQGTELFGKTMGIVGMGNIGRLVAERALGLRMKVIAHDPYISKDTNLNMPIELVDMDEIFKLSDVITVHTPLTSTTKNLISKGSIDMMKEGVRIINCARGGIVNEEDVAEAISNGKIGGLAIDVFESEPPDFKSPIFKLSDKVVFTPHLGASTQEAQTKVGIAMAEQVIEFANKGVVSNAVNMPSMSTEVLSEISPYLELAEKLGSFMGQTCKVGVKEIIVEYGGNVAEMNVAPLTVTALKGYLSPVMSAPVTYVNAPLIAEERGIKLNSFLSASGIAAYPDSISKTFSEKNSVSIPDSFINQVVVKWESKVLEFEKQLPSISFSILRIGLVLSKEGGVFSISKKLSMIYALSPLGRGNQWQSWIHIDDASSIFLKCINNTSKGVFNLVAPNPVVQSELLRKIALYNRSAIILPNIPKFIVKLFFGQMSELVLSSQKVISNNLNDYNFKFPDIDSAIKNLSN